ncbi:MAG: hypothetical protein CVT65_05735 [Actinobacteria bacterium HGW-Actinobacteria-5]|jgi:hypothetical protein|nr:MAG: hypothetical protein CVT65_05735 [Actinobacteria bacterium HGW-Actinobacteria-5]
MTRLDADVTECLLPLFLLDVRVGVGVLHRAIRLADQAVLRPVAVREEDPQPGPDGFLEARARQTGEVKVPGRE